MSSPRGACAGAGGRGRSDPLPRSDGWACWAAEGLRGAAAAWSADALLLGACTRGHRQPERASSLSCQNAPLFQICQRSVISCGRFPPPRSLPLPLAGDSCDSKGLAACPDEGRV